MNRLFFVLTLIALLGLSKITLAADVAQGTWANSAGQTNVTVTTNTLVLTYDQTRVHWNVHPEGTNGVRCYSGWSNGAASPLTPTTTAGEELLGNGYFDSSPWTNPQLSLTCTAESGSVVLSVWQDYR